MNDRSKRLPDLTTDGNGGVLLGMLAASQPDVGLRRDPHDGTWLAGWDHQYDHPHGQVEDGEGATLGEACARALLAVHSRKESP